MSEPPRPPDAHGPDPRIQVHAQFLFALASLAVEYANAFGLEPDEPIIFEAPPPKDPREPLRGVRLTIERRSIVIPGTGSGPLPRNFRGG